MPRKDYRPKVKVCPLCGKEFTHRGNAVRCKECRFRCLQCGVPKKSYGKLCNLCKHKAEMAKNPICKHPGCDRHIMRDNESGYCQTHRDYSQQANHFKAKIERQRNDPDYPKEETGKIRDVPVICTACNKPFLAVRETVKLSIRRGTGLVCSRQCQGLRAIKLAPKKATSIEIAIEKALQQRDVIYQSQVPLCGITIVDFYLPEHKTVIYCDGDFWHRPPERKAKDRYQNKVLKRNGYKVFRFSETDIVKSPDECLDRIPNLSKPPFHQLRFPTF